MKQLILLTTVLLISVEAMAIECTKANGTEIMGKNDTVYCKSNQAMNWWTALGWCQAIGKTPFRYPQDCSCVGERCYVTTVDCPNLEGVGDNINIWTAIPHDSSWAYRVNLSSGNFTFGGTDGRNHKNYAFCY